MKKIIFYFLSAIVLVVGTSLVYACTHESMNETSVSQQDSYEKLRYELKQYNDIYAPPQYVETRRGGFWRKLASIFGADAAGACLGSAFGGVGAVVVGIGNSLLFAAMGDEFLCTEEYTYGEELHIGFVRISEDLEYQQKTYASFPMVQLTPEINSRGLGEEITDINPVPIVYEKVRTLSLTSNKVGYLHNKIISDLLSEDENLLHSSTSVIMDKVVESVEQEGFQVSSQLEQDVLEQLNKVAIQCPDLESSIAVYRNNFPEYSDMFDILQDFITNASSCFSESSLESYTKGYLDIIAESELSTTEKDAVISAIDVATNSILLWCVE